MIRYCYGIKMVKVDGMWTGNILGQEISVKKVGKLWSSNWPSVMEFKTLKSAIYHAIKSVINVHYDEIVNGGLNGIKIDRIDYKTRHVLFNGKVIGEHTASVAASYIAMDIINSECLRG